MTFEVPAIAVGAAHAQNAQTQSSDKQQPMEEATAWQTKEMQLVGAEATEATEAADAECGMEAFRLAFAGA